MTNNNDMNINKLAAIFAESVESPPYEVGSTYFFRCVTYHYIGTVVHVGLMEVVLKNVVWVADSGKFQDCLEKGTVADYQHYRDGDPVVLGRFSVVDATPWRNPLPPKR